MKQLTQKRKNNPFITNPILIKAQLWAVVPKCMVKNRCIVRFKWWQTFTRKDRMKLKEKVRKLPLSYHVLKWMDSVDHKLRHKSIKKEDKENSEVLSHLLMNKDPFYWISQLLTQVFSNLVIFKLLSIIRMGIISKLHHKSLPLKEVAEEYHKHKCHG